ncbi:hypothetical protein TRVA0_048S00166 [Trichomonascus vanleenenianus]|uniref:uncharacterized protein n=1 Tax=Trichomonascus vanleenenianus TaxID=2268995 RepID=UPI003EC999E7
MVSKLSIASLALAVASALGQTDTCTVSDAVQTILNDIDTLTTANTNFASALAEWVADTSNTGLLAAAGSQAAALISDISDVATAFSDSTNPSSCEVATVLNKFSDASGTIESTLAALGDASADVTGSYAAVAKGDIEQLGDATVALLASAYAWLPCADVSLAVSAVSNIIQALNNVETAFTVQLSVAPVQPQCGPVCKKKPATTVSATTNVVATTTPVAATTTSIVYF